MTILLFSVLLYMLSIMTKALPCGEVSNYDITKVDILPLSFIDIINYLRIYPKNGNEYEVFFYKYNLLRNKVKNLEKLYLPDIYYLMYVMWGISINSEIIIDVNYDCLYCGETNKCTINNAEVKFKKFDFVAKDYIFSNRQKLTFSIPKGEYIEKELPKFIHKRNIPLDIAMLIISFEQYRQFPVEVEKMVLGATQEDALLMLNILSLVKDPIIPYEHACNNCEEVNKLDINSIVSNDFFRIFVENTRVIGDESSFK